MEVKINREIREYTESMFFGLSMRQFVFSVMACGMAVGLYFLLRPYFGRALWGVRLHQVPRHERRTVPVGMDKRPISDAQNSDF